MNQDQTPVRADTPENDKAKPIHGADQTPPKPQPAKEAPPATPPKA